MSLKKEISFGDRQLFFTLFFKKVSHGRECDSNKETKKWKWKEQKQFMEDVVKTAGGRINATADRSLDYGENLQSEMHSNKQSSFFF